MTAPVSPLRLSPVPSALPPLPEKPPLTTAELLAIDSIMDDAPHPALDVTLKDGISDADLKSLLSASDRGINFALFPPGTQLVNLHLATSAPNTGWYRGGAVVNIPCLDLFFFPDTKRFLLQWGKGSLSLNATTTECRAKPYCNRATLLESGKELGSFSLRVATAPPLSRPGKAHFMGEPPNTGRMATHICLREVNLIVIPDLDQLVLLQNSLFHFLFQKGSDFHTQCIPSIDRFIPNPPPKQSKDKQ